jgi:hypothetical protein
MAGLDPAIYLKKDSIENDDARIKPGHDDTISLPAI